LNHSIYSAELTSKPRTRQRKKPPTEAASLKVLKVGSAPQQKDYDDDHQYRAEAATIIVIGSAEIETTSTKKENQNNQE
jgi:hypothetical protein